METFNESQLTPEWVSELVSAHNGYTGAAEWLTKNYKIESTRYPGKYLTAHTLRAILSKIHRLEITTRDDVTRESRIEKLLHTANIPSDAINRIENVKLGIWGVHAKDEDGNIQTSYLDKTQITVVPSAPAFPVANVSEPREIKFTTTDTPRLLRTTWQAVIVSDAQVGFLMDPETKEIEPIHDPAAMSVAKEITHDVHPDELYWIGDWMDWPFLSRWQQHDEFDAVNESIQAGYDELCLFISAAGPQVRKKVMIGGNHDIRPEKFLLEHNRKAMRVRRAGDTTGWPVFSQQFLLRYDELGIEIPGYYPGGEYYMLPDLLLTHEPPKAAEFQASVIHGHTHKLTKDCRVQHSAEGRKTYFTYDIGCLCRVGQTSNPYRLLRTQTPSNRARTNFAQGLAVVSVVDGKIPFHQVDQISILEGKALYGGKLYEV